MSGSPARSRWIVQEVGDETLIYDTTTNRAHCLNRTAAAVWRGAPGAASLAEIGERASDLAGIAVSAEAADLAVRDLRRAGLLPDGAVAPAGPLTRRELHRRVKLGLGAALAPAVLSIVAPTPAAAVSCLGGGAACQNNADCCSNRCTRVGGVKVCLSA